MYRYLHNSNCYPIALLCIALFAGTLDDDTPMQELMRLQTKISHFPLHQQLYTVFQLAHLQRKQKKTVELLLDVHGYQILSNGCFNGDPHPGNILTLSNGKMGLIDYGQCKILNDNERLAIAAIVAQLGAPQVNDAAVATAMHDFGFRFKNPNRTDIIRETACLFFDSDSGRRKVIGCSTPQLYLSYLQAQNPFLTVPDAAVFTARTSFLFRGMGALLGLEVHTSQRWSSNVK